MATGFQSLCLLAPEVALAPTRSVFLVILARGSNSTTTTTYIVSTPPLALLDSIAFSTGECTLFTSAAVALLCASDPVVDFATVAIEGVTANDSLTAQFGSLQGNYEQQTGVLTIQGPASASASASANPPSWDSWPSSLWLSLVPSCVHAEGKSPLMPSN